jgi:hypothetical protein
MTGEDMEAQQSPEATAAKGMETRKKVGDRLAEWKKEKLAKNPVSKEIMTSWNKIKATAKEGSFREYAMGKLTPIVEHAAALQGMKTENTKKLLQITAVGLGLASIPAMLGGPELAVPLQVLGKVAGPVSMMVEGSQKYGAQMVGHAAEAWNKIGLPKKVDGIVDKILGWKGPEVKPVMPKMA